MPERLEKLKTTVRELEAELHSIDSLDAEAQRLLEEAVSEMQTAIQRSDPHHLEPESLSDNLRQAAERFESTHPTLFGVVSRMIDALAQMGI
jgi:hypothetical protein